MEDLWSPDPDPAIAAPEQRLSAALTGYLYHVHLSAHRALGLPPVPQAEVAAAYRLSVLPTFAKADQPEWSKAAQLFSTLSHTPRAVRSVDDLATALAQSWYERGLLENVTSRSVVQAQLVGRIRAAHDQPVPPHWRSVFEDDDAPTGVDARAVGWATERACLHVRHLKDSTRAMLAGAVVDALLRGDSAAQLAGALTARFGTLNRDARRLAVTELSFARSNGFLEGVSPGEQVEWFAAADACAACQHLHGRRLTVTRGPADPETCVWPGKHNVGLKSGDRTPSIPLHPNCRCRWVRVLRAPPLSSGRLTALLDAIEAME